MNRWMVTGSLAAFVAMLIFACSPQLGAQYNTKIYTEQGGEKRVYESGAELEIRSGATIDIQSGATVADAGTTSWTGAKTIASGGSLTAASGSTVTGATGSTVNVSGTGNIWGTTSVKSGGTLNVDSGGARLDALGSTVNVSGTTNDWGTRTVKDLGALVVEAGGQVKLPVISKSANFTVLAGQSGSTFIATAVDVVFTLPATAAGLRYTIISKAPSGGAGVKISPQAADKIMGTAGTVAFSSLDDKDAINTGATDAEGDSMTLVGDGVDGWFIVNSTGVWARE